MIVVDTNVIAYFFLAGVRTESVQAVFDRDPHWIAPALWKSEFRSVLGLYEKRVAQSFDRIEPLAMDLQQHGRGVRRARDRASAAGRAQTGVPDRLGKRQEGFGIVTPDAGERAAL